jgi:hypothetical protein
MVLKYEEDSRGRVQKRQLQHAFSRRKSEAAVFMAYHTLRPVSLGDCVVKATGMSD